MFEVAAVSPDNPQVIYCTEHHWKVFHDRLAVLADPEDIPVGLSAQSVPRVVELRKVSAATDLYGVGALLLYSAYAAGVARKASAPSKEGASSAAISNALDAGFAALIRAIDNVQYVKMIWGMLDELCNQLAEHYSKPDGERRGQPWRATVSTSSKRAGVSAARQRRQLSRT